MEEIPTELLRDRAKHFVFNTQGLVIQASNKTKYKGKRRSYFCTCGVCRKHTAHSWKITFTRKKNFPSIWKLAPDYCIQNAKTHRSPTFRILTDQILANFPPFQKFILDRTFQLNTNRPTTKNVSNMTDSNVLRTFLQAHPNVTIDTARSKRVNYNTSLHKMVGYARRSIIRYHTQNLIVIDDRSSYRSLPSFVQVLMNKNPRATIALQKDSEGRFLRFFLATPIATNTLLGSLTYPVFVADCSHYKEVTYDGNIFVLSTKTSFDEIIILAFAIIPPENKRHLYWIIEMCWRHGIPLEEHALFSDEGPLLNTLSLISKTRGVSFFLMICVEHFFRNICSNLPGIDEALRERVHARLLSAGASDTYSDFIDSLNSMLDLLLDEYGTDVEKTMACYKIMEFILRRHPKTWTVFANSLSFQDLRSTVQEHYVKYHNSFNVVLAVYDQIQHFTSPVSGGGTIYDAVVYAMVKNVFVSVPNYKFTEFSTASCPRFGFRTTNASEISANSFKTAGARSVPPFDSIKMLIQVYNHQCECLKDKAESIPSTSVPYDRLYLTPPGIKIKSMWSNQKHAEHINGEPIFQSCESLSNGVKLTLLQRHNQVDVHEASLTWGHSENEDETGVISSAGRPMFRFHCDLHVTNTQMYLSPCACHALVFNEAKKHHRWPLSPTTTAYDFEKYMYPSHFDGIKLKRLLCDHSPKLAVPSKNETKNVIIDDVLLPPPKYKNAGVGKGKRIPSRGESTRSLRGSGRRKNNRPKFKRNGLVTPVSNKRASLLRCIDSTYTDPNDASLNVDGINALESVSNATSGSRRVQDDAIHNISVEAPSLLSDGRYSVLSPSDLPEPIAWEALQQVMIANSSSFEEQSASDVPLFLDTILLKHFEWGKRFFPGVMEAYVDVSLSIRESDDNSIEVDLDDKKLDTVTECEFLMTQATDVDQLQASFENDATDIGLTQDADLGLVDQDDEPHGSSDNNITDPAMTQETDVGKLRAGFDCDHEAFFEKEATSSGIGKYQHVSCSESNKKVPAQTYGEYLQGVTIDGSVFGLSPNSTNVESKKNVDKYVQVDGLQYLHHRLISEMIQIGMEKEAPKISACFLRTNVLLTKPKAHDFDSVFQTLEHNNSWFNDNLIDRYIDLLIKTKHSDWPVKVYTRATIDHLMDEHQKLDFTRFSGHKNCPHAGYTLMEMKFVLMPFTDDVLGIGSSSHYILCFISPPDKIVYIYDSCFGPNSSRAENPIEKYKIRVSLVKEFLKWKLIIDDSIEDDIDEVGPWSFKPFMGSTQVNGSDCGVFMLAAIYNIFWDKSPVACTTFRDDIYFITKFRFCVFFSVISGSLITPIIESKLPPTKKTSSKEKLLALRNNAVLLHDSRKKKGQKDNGPKVTKATSKHVVTTGGFPRRRLMDRISAGRDAVFATATTPAMRASNTATTPEMKAWLHVHGIRYWSRDGKPQLVERTLATVRNMLLVKSTLEESMKAQSINYERRLQQIDSINNLSNGTYEEKTKLLEVWGVNSKMDTSNNCVDGEYQPCASGKNCFFSNRIIYGHGKDVCSRCHKPTHGTLCMKGDVCMACSLNNLEFHSRDSVGKKTSQSDNCVQKRVLECPMAPVKRMAPIKRRKHNVDDDADESLNFEEGTKNDSPQITAAKSIGIGVAVPKVIRITEETAVAKPDLHRMEEKKLPFNLDDGGLFSEEDDASYQTPLSANEIEKYRATIDTLQVGDHVLYQVDCLRHVRGKIDGWHRKNGLPYVGPLDEWNPQIHARDQPKRSTIVQNLSSKIVNFRAGRECGLYTLKRNESDHFYCPRAIFEEQKELGSDLMRGGKLVCQCVKNLESNHELISGHFEKMTTTEVLQIAKNFKHEFIQRQNRARNMIFFNFCCACKAPLEKVDCIHFYRCKCVHGRPRFLYCSNCLSDEGEFVEGCFKDPSGKSPMVTRSRSKIPDKSVSDDDDDDDSDSFSFLR